MRLLECGLVELALIEPSRINIQCLFIDFSWVQSSCKNKRRIHLTTAIGRENFSTEVQQTIHQEHDCILITIAVASLCCVEEWVGIATRTVRPADDSRKNSTRCVWSERTDELTNKVVFVGSIVVGFHTVKFDENFIYELGSADEVICSILGNDEILGEEFQHLIITFKRCPLPIVRVAKGMQSLPINIDFLWSEMRYRNVTHVESNGSVSEHWKIVFCTNQTLFNRFRSLIPALQFLHTFDLLW